ncbi:MAG: hypothetical protein KDA27_14050 [Candidatus Eisenbacteria bacterium]|uniref:Uncharacterized protein n=1 Tax=Eiseniibacteriota bacterium TaxID=2212470 RepID=A0A956SG33_UNCEI|nr:hypothetical protein [Candidatus Eisenbacteria bacterium]MCB9892765.1 hypothetical protein [Planctomycetota bacterium]
METLGRSLLFVWLAVALVCGASTSPRTADAAVPTSVHYQGKLEKDGAIYGGVAQFKFAILKGATRTLWSNDGTSTNGSEPQSAVSVTVTDGIFSVQLGSSPMLPITADALEDVASTLRIWVDTGDGVEQLPDQPLSSVPNALNAETATRAREGFTANGQIHSTTGGFRFPDGSIQTTAATGAGGGGSLDAAYDFGGPGAGRTIVADAGEVRLEGSGGLYSKGNVGIGIPPTGRKLEVLGNVGFDGDANLTGSLDAGGTITTGSAGVDGRLVVEGETGLPVGIIEVDPLTHGGRLAIRTSTDGHGAWLIGRRTGGGGALSLYDSSETLSIDLRGSHSSSDPGGWMALKDLGQDRLRFLARNGNTGTGGLIEVLDGAGNTTIQLVGYDGAQGARVITPKLEITGGADLAEPFAFRDDEEVHRGAVVVIDPLQPGHLTLCTQPYDRRVAGVVSGAGGVEPGLTMRQEGVTQAGHAVALTGRAYALATASGGPIAPGDLLTTSSVPGHAMKANDLERSPGAVIGKAMSSLESGTGLVLVLVNLQ